MPDVYEKIMHCRRGSAVQRFHAAPLINPSAATNGLHTDNMMQLLFLIIRKEVITVDLCESIVWHDSLYEQITSDVSGEVKADWPELKRCIVKKKKSIDKEFQLMPIGSDKRIVKALDLLECFLFSCEQLAIGNRTVESEQIRQRVKQRAIQRLNEIKELDYYSWSLPMPHKFVEQIENSILEHVK